jgi:hypothetical protein
MLFGDVAGEQLGAGVTVGGVLINVPPGRKIKKHRGDNTPAVLLASGAAARLCLQSEI